MQHDSCGNCKYFVEPRTCTRRPRLAQNYDDKTSPHLWCQYHERRTDMENRNNEAEALEIPPELREEEMAAAELLYLADNLLKFQENARTSIADAAEAGNSDLVAEIRGMLKVTKMVREQVMVRAETLGSEK